MSHKLDGPVETQMAVAILNNTIRGDCFGSRTDVKPVGRRRVFVQTETGCVLGLELDRGDNVHTVKRKLQLALNVPTDGSSLTFGDLVLKNDLSAVRGDFPLLLKRDFIHRSSSTPCLSPRGNDLQPHDISGPVEIIGCSSRCSRTKQLVKGVVKGIKSGVDPIPVNSGLGGAYYFRNAKGESVAIVKPTDEEPFAPNNPKGFVGKSLGQPGLKRSVRVGETGFREVAAYLLDHDNFANVPPTVLVKVTHSIFHINEVNGCSNKVHDRKHTAASKIASFQQFVSHDFDASDHGTSSFPVAAVHRIGMLDIRIFNTDRHGGNLLVRKSNAGIGNFGGMMELIPIDHGLCLPETLEDPYFEWIHWPQASIPFSEDELDYIAKLDPAKDSEMLRKELPMIREACLRMLVLCTIFLKEAAKQGLCLAEMGEMMSREFTGGEEEPSELELVCMEALDSIGEREAISFDLQDVEEEEFQFDLDCDVDSYLMTQVQSNPYGFRGGNGKIPLSKLEEGLDEGEDCEVEDEESTIPTDYAHLPPPTVSKLSMSLKGVSFSERTRRYPFGNQKGDCVSGGRDNNRHNGGPQVGDRRSADEQLTSSTTFVSLADMSEDEWAAFLGKFKDLLPGTLEGRKCGAAAQRLKQRLGTSCQF